MRLSSALRRAAAPAVLAVLALLLVLSNASAETLGTFRVSNNIARDVMGTYALQVAVSADGNTVAYSSPHPSLVPADNTGYYDIFVWNRGTGVTELVSVTPAGQAGNGSSVSPTLSADGRYVGFISYANDLVTGDTNEAPDIFVRDRLRGVTERIEATLGDAVSLFQGVAQMSDDGRYVVFHSIASNLVPSDANGVEDVFVFDRQLHTMERVSVSEAGVEGNSGSFWPSISADGRLVAFTSAASNLVANDTNDVSDVFVHDRQVGTTWRCSVKGINEQLEGYSFRPEISANGEFVAFLSSAPGIVPVDNNGTTDVFVRDLIRGVTELVSVNIYGETGPGTPTNEHVDISADGRFVVFHSGASDLDFSFPPGSGRGVFVRDRQLNTTGKVNVQVTPKQFTTGAFSPRISANGQWVVFCSPDKLLVPDDTDEMYDAFIVHRSPSSWNLPPVAFAGPDRQIALPHDGSPASGAARVVFDGRNSNDPDGTIISYQWYIPARGVWGTGPRFEQDFDRGTHQVILKVFDLYGASDEDVITVTVAAEPNLPPTAHAGAGQQVVVPHDGDPGTNTVTVSLNGSYSSDPEGDALAFQWRDALGALLSEAASLTRTVPPGKHTFRLRVTDLYGAYDEESVSVHVLPEPNQAPVADAGPDQLVRVSRETGVAGVVRVQLDASRSFDPDGDLLGFSWMDTSGTVQADTASWEVDLAPGKHSFLVQVTDLYGAVDQSRVTVLVAPARNRPPVARAGNDQDLRLAPDATPETGTVEATLDAGRSHDPDGDLLAYEWRDGNDAVVGAGTTLTSNLSAGVHTFFLTVTDPFGATGQDRVTVRVLPARNRTPIARAGEDVAVAEGTGKTTGVALNGTASSDPDGHALTYEWSVLERPVGTGPEPTVDLEPGRHKVKLTVTDPWGATATDIVYVTVGVVDVTGEVQIRRGRLTRVSGRGAYTLVVRVANRTAGVLPGPVSLVVDGLPNTVKVTNAEGLTSEATGKVGSPYVTERKDGLAPGPYQAVTLHLNVRGKPNGLPGSLRVLAGIGPR